MSQKRQRINSIFVDISTPNRIIKENEDNKNTYLVKYDNNYVFEDKNYMEINYPELVEDYNQFIITGEKYYQEFLQQKALFQHILNNICQTKIKEFRSNTRENRLSDKNV